MTCTHSYLSRVAVQRQHACTSPSLTAAVLCAGPGRGRPARCVWRRLRRGCRCSTQPGPGRMPARVGPSPPCDAYIAWRRRTGSWGALCRATESPLRLRRVQAPTPGLLSRCWPCRWRPEGRWLTRPVRISRRTLRLIAREVRSAVLWKDLRPGLSSWDPRPSFWCSLILDTQVRSGATLPSGSG